MILCLFAGCFCLHRYGNYFYSDPVPTTTPTSGGDDANGTGDICAAAEVGLKSTVDVVRVVNRYYAYNLADKVGDLPSWSLQDNVPSLFSGGTIPTTPPASSSLPLQQQQRVMTSAAAASLLSEAKDTPGAGAEALQAQATAEEEVSILTSYWDTVNASSNEWAPVFFNAVLNGINQYTPWLEEAATGFFTFKQAPPVPVVVAVGNGSSTVWQPQLTLGSLLHDMLVCDFESVMFCGQPTSSTTTTTTTTTATTATTASLTPSTSVIHRRNLAMCLLVSLAAWVAIGMFVSMVPFGIGTVLSVLVYASLWALVPARATAMHLAYGTAVTCLPMVPTCAWQDLILSLQVVLPIRIEWPAALQRLVLFLFVTICLVLRTQLWFGLLMGLHAFCFCLLLGASFSTLFAFFGPLRGNNARVCTGTPAA